MEHVIGRMLDKHCSCSGANNRIYIESITICPRCQSLLSTLIYQIPRERLKEVLEKLMALMSELGIQQEGQLPPVSLKKKEQEGHRESPQSS